MNFTVYEGTPLNTKSRDIRLIEVLPRNGDSPIHCKFHRHSIGSPDLEFQALSYTWGNLKPLSTIFIDNVAVEVRQNLVLFLRQHRSEASTSKCNPLMWIDALCIDQSNTNERNHQVALMKDIYSKVIYDHTFSNQRLLTQNCSGFPRSCLAWSCSRAQRCGY